MGTCKSKAATLVAGRRFRFSPPGLQVFHRYYGRHACRLVDGRFLHHSFCSHGPVPNDAYEPGCVIKLVKKAIVREAESVQSSRLLKATTGTMCTVVQRGDQPRRLRVEVMGTDIEGWISCQTLSGKKLVQEVREISILNDVGNGHGDSDCSRADITLLRTVARDSIATDLCPASPDMCVEDTLDVDLSYQNPAVCGWTVSRVEENSRCRSIESRVRTQQLSEFSNIVAVF